MRLLVALAVAFAASFALATIGASSVAAAESGDAVADMSTGRSLLSRTYFTAWLADVTICQAVDPTRSDYCCPKGCGKMGVCVRNVGCSCLPGWATRADCSTNFLRYMSLNQLYFIIIFSCSILFMLFVFSLINTLTWVGKEAYASAWVCNIIAVLFSIMHLIWWAWDPFNQYAGMPPFLQSWWYNFLFTAAIGFQTFVGVHWHKMFIESGGEKSAVSTFSNPPGMIFFFVCMALFQLAGAIVTSVMNWEWIWIRIYQIIYIILAFGNGFVFGIRAYQTSGKADNKAIVGIGKVAMFNGFMILLLATLNIAFYNTYTNEWGQFIRNPDKMYALSVMNTLIVTLMGFASIYAVRSEAVEKILSKLPGRSYEEPFSPGNTYRSDPDDPSDEARYKGNRGGLDRGNKSDQTIVEYPDTSSLSLQRESSHAEVRQDQSKRARPNIDATSDSTRDW